MRTQEEAAQEIRALLDDVAAARGFVSPKTVAWGTGKWLAEAIRQAGATGPEGEEER